MEQKIRQALEDGKAVKCTTLDEFSESIRAAKQCDEIYAEELWGRNDGDLCVWMYSNGGWNYGTTKTVTEDHREAVLFSSLTQPNLIKALHAVGVGDWLQEGVEFEFRMHKYRINAAGRLLICVDTWMEHTTAHIVCAMFNHPEEIKPVQVWSEESIENAKSDLRRFKYVARNDNGKTWLFTNKPFNLLGAWQILEGNYYRVSESEYSDVKNGQCVPLSEIAGCGGE